MTVDFAEQSAQQLTAHFSRHAWKALSFPSTLYLQPILDILLEPVPVGDRMAVQLGLQEALVNAAKHGNGLDPEKSISIRYAKTSRELCWIISDQGQGFTPPRLPCQGWSDGIPCESEECGRGLFILYQVFDQVHWNNNGTQLALYKRHAPTHRRLALAFRPPFFRTLTPDL
ncbi:MAG: ATP-binding protein [Synechococcales cyanobacterium RM1_1_8]|nr:ATP-binding protein [Synechococcales cyanobacterium RM1_1_8]